MIVSESCEQTHNSTEGIHRMTTEQSDIRLSGIFGRIINSSRKLLGRDQNATSKELESLSTLIDKEIIPRLQMTFSTQQSFSPAEQEITQAPEYDTEGFVSALLSSRPDDAREYIDDLLASDHSLTQIYKHLLTPSARRLGELWEDDLCSFANVTIAITKIRHIFISTAPLFPLSIVEDSTDQPSILLTTVPGEQHTFGLYLVVEIFREAGWTVWSGTPRSARELTELVARERYDVVGLSIVAGKNLPVAAAAITNIRKNSANRGIKVLLGGRIAAEQPDNIKDLDADIVVTDPDDIIKQANKMLSEVKRL